jgi:alpha-mannosidase
VKKHETRDTLVVRLYNLTGVRQEAALRFAPAVLAAWRTDLLEERECDLMVGDAHNVVVELGPHEIGTVEVAFSAIPVL